jgi:O-6-methylguanine DNA methyltransferase
VRLFHSPLDTPIGEMFAMASDSALCVLEFGPRRPVRRSFSGGGSAAGATAGDRLAARLRKWFPPHEIVEGQSPIIDLTRQWLARYFAGSGADPSDVPLDLRGSEFERRVWQVLLQIPAGQTRSYASIARDLGQAGAARAVGLANGANPLAIIVPCHRVIGANGALTGYGGGLERKLWLLKHEACWRRGLPLMDLMRDAQPRV